MNTGYVALDDRGLLGISGEDARDFLQGLVSNDVRKVAADQAVYAAFLTPQGKFLHDFFVVEFGGGLLLDCEKHRVDDLKRRLNMYRLRAKVTLADQTDDFVVAALMGDGVAGAVGLAPTIVGRSIPLGQGIAYVDPRLADMGVRAVLPRSGATATLENAGLRALDLVDYDQLRIRLGIPDGSRDMEVEKAILLENGVDELHGVDWDKGCYMGQELTARTKYRALIKKRLVPVNVEGPLPAPGTKVLLGDKEAGEIRSGTGNQALALMRLEHLDQAAASGEPFVAGSARVTPKKPDWATF